MKYTHDNNFVAGGQVAGFLILIMAATLIAQFLPKFSCSVRIGPYPLMPCEYGGASV